MINMADDHQEIFRRLYMQFVVGVTVIAERQAMIKYKQNEVFDKVRFV